MSSDLEIPQALYDSEISFSISCLWDNGFECALGIAPNYNEAAHVDSYIEACRWLREAAFWHYPDSAFARKYGRGLRLV
jgi:hypothetical protein